MLTNMDLNESLRLWYYQATSYADDAPANRITKILSMTKGVNEQGSMSKSHTITIN